MDRHHMPEHIYDNTRWMKRDVCEKTKPIKEKNHLPVACYVLLVLFVFSMLINGILAYAYFFEDKNTLHCETVTNCSNSDYYQDSPGCTYEEDWKSIKLCPELPMQWFKGNGTFYLFSSYNKTWNSSKEHCKTLGGDLVIVNNQEEKDFLTQRLCVIGETDLYWSGNRTDQDSKQNCLVLRGNSQEEILCSREERSICEFPCSS